jgi:DUF1680 family protein
MLQQHPATNQKTLTIARGPLIFCAEDVDNEWVDDHFKSVLISSKAMLEEYIGHDEVLDENYIKIIVHGEINKEQNIMTGSFPGFEAENKDEDLLKNEKVKIVFIPYFYRGNRDGKGHMRVGFRRLD